MVTTSHLQKLWPRSKWLADRRLGAVSRPLFSVNPENRTGSFFGVNERTSPAFGSVPNILNGRSRQLRRFQAVNLTRKIRQGSFRA